MRKKKQTIILQAELAKLTSQGNLEPILVMFLNVDKNNTFYQWGLYLKEGVVHTGLFFKSGETDREFALYANNGTENSIRPDKYSMAEMTVLVTDYDCGLRILSTLNQLRDRIDVESFSNLPKDFDKSKRSVLPIHQVEVEIPAVIDT